MHQARRSDVADHETAFCGLIIVMLLGEVVPLGVHRLGLPFALGPVLGGAIVVFLSGIVVFVAGVIRAARKGRAPLLVGGGAFLVAAGLGVFLGAALVNALDWVPTGTVIHNPGLDFALPSVLIFTATVSYLLTLVNVEIAQQNQPRR
ncbi:MAG TPA: hypothetical protein VKY65_02985 [Alphaproteobacteria bacterium]|nr:hypothetical protein [Alphaproteobacteria bacterium]